MRPKARCPIVVPEGKGRFFDVFGEKITMKIEGETTEGRFAIFEEVSPAGGGPPPHQHHETDEIFCIIEGRFEIQCGDQFFELGPGDVAYLPKGVPHVVQCVSDTRGRFLAIVTPAGLEQFFDEVHRRSEDGELDPREAAELARQYDVEILPPSAEVLGTEAEE